MDQPDREDFLHRLTATPQGREHMLRIAVDAEEGDEGGIFDLLATMVDEPRLQRLVVRHRDDEVRHASLFRACLDRNGFEMAPVPDQLRIIRRIADHLGGSKPGTTPREFVLNIYALLCVIEQRGVERFPLIAAAFRAVDPETADTYLAVAEDERRHIQYCAAIGRHYATTDAEWELAVEHARSIEAAAFQATDLAHVAYVTEHGLSTA